MSAQPDLLEHALAGDIFEYEVTEPQAATARAPCPWNPDRFGEEQIRSLVRQIFLPGMAEAGAPGRLLRGRGRRCRRNLSARQPGSGRADSRKRGAGGDISNIDLGRRRIRHADAGPPSGRVQPHARRRAENFGTSVARASRSLPGGKRIRTFGGMATRHGCANCGLNLITPCCTVRRLRCAVMRRCWVI